MELCITQAAGLANIRPQSFEAQFFDVFVANEAVKPALKRSELRVWPDGMRTDDKVVRIDSGVPRYTSKVIR